VGIPVGFIFTPIQICRNIAGIRGAPDPNVPSEQYELLIRLDQAAGNAPAAAIPNLGNNPQPGTSPQSIQTTPPANIPNSIVQTPPVKPLDNVDQAADVWVVLSNLRAYSPGRASRQTEATLHTSFRKTHFEISDSKSARNSRSRLQQN